MFREDPRPTVQFRHGKLDPQLQRSLTSANMTSVENTGTTGAVDTANTNPPTEGRKTRRQSAGAAFRPIPVSVASLVGHEFQKPFTLKDDDPHLHEDGSRSAPSSPKRARDEARKQAKDRDARRLRRSETASAADYLHSNPPGVSTALAEGVGHASLVNDTAHVAPFAKDRVWKAAKQADGLQAADDRIRRLSQEELRKASQLKEEDAKAKASEMAILGKLGTNLRGAKP